MQSIAYMVALSCFAVLTIFAIGLLVLGKLNQWGFVAMWSLTILACAAIAWGAKKMWFRLGPGSIEGGVETAKATIDTHTQDKLKEIDRDIEFHKESITTLLKEANETGQRLSEHEQSINSLIIQAAQVESSLQEAIEDARPPVLALQTNTSEQRVDGIATVFSLFPDKNQPLGLVSVVAKIITDITNSKILSMSNKSGGGLVIGTRNAVLRDGNQTAVMLYNPPVPMPIQIEIVVSEPCRIFVGGTYVIEPNEFCVELPTQ